MAVSVPFYYSCYLLTVPNLQVKPYLHSACIGKAWYVWACYCLKLWGCTQSFGVHPRQKAGCHPGWPHLGLGHIVTSLCGFVSAAPLAGWIKELPVDVDE